MVCQTSGMPRPSGSHTTVDDERIRGRRAVLAALAGASEPSTVSELAHRAGLHTNTVRAHLAALISAGQVGRMASITNRPGRPTLRYVAIPGMDPGGVRHYRLLATVMADEFASAPDAAARMTAVGRSWGRRLAKIDRRRTGDRSAAVRRAVQVLDELGFDPGPVGTNSFDVAIGLRHCPFLEIARARPQVICALHLGLVQGILAEGSRGDAVTATGITPFASPNLCVITLGDGDPSAAAVQLRDPRSESVIHEPEARV